MLIYARACIVQYERNFSIYLVPNEVIESIKLLIEGFGKMNVKYCINHEEAPLYPLIVTGQRLLNRLSVKSRQERMLVMLYNIIKQICNFNSMIFYL